MEKVHSPHLGLLAGVCGAEWGGRGHPGVKRQQDSPGRSVDLGLASGRERRQLRHLAQKGHDTGKGGRR